MSLLDHFHHDDYDILYRALENYANNLKSRVKAQKKAHSTKGYQKKLDNENTIERIRDIQQILNEEFAC